MDFNIIGSLATIIAVLAGFFEWRIRVMYRELNEKIKDRDQVHKVIQDNLKDDIARLEGKIDMLIHLQIQKAITNDKNS